MPAYRSGSGSLAGRRAFSVPVLEVATRFPADPIGAARTVTRYALYAPLRLMASRVAARRPYRFPGRGAGRRGWAENGERATALRLRGPVAVAQFRRPVQRGRYRVRAPKRPTHARDTRADRRRMISCPNCFWTGTPKRFSEVKSAKTRSRKMVKTKTQISVNCNCVDSFFGNVFVVRNLNVCTRQSNCKP